MKITYLSIYVYKNEIKIHMKLILYLGSTTRLGRDLSRWTHCAAWSPSCWRPSPTTSLTVSSRSWTRTVPAPWTLTSSARWWCPRPPTKHGAFMKRSIARLLFYSKACARARVWAATRRLSLPLCVSGVSWYIPIYPCLNPPHPLSPLWTKLVLKSGGYITLCSRRQLLYLTTRISYCLEYIIKYIYFLHNKWFLFSFYRVNTLFCIWFWIIMKSEKLYVVQKHVIYKCLCCYLSFRSGPLHPYPHFATSKPSNQHDISFMSCH